MLSTTTPNRSQSPSWRIQVDDFVPLIGERFWLRTEAGSIAVALMEVSPSGSRALGLPAGRVGFSLVFQGPQTPALPQRIYRIEHPRRDGLDLFLVPIGESEAGIRYQAVFN
jgi:uncharacterized protein DUF6916